jgi:hypothetical protein
VVGTLVMMTMNAFFVVMVEDEINCRHLSWLVMSMSGAVLSGLLWFMDTNSSTIYSDL